MSRWDRSDEGATKSVVEPVCRPSTFGSLVLMSLHKYIWERRQQHMG